jgi:hypothetical protein
MMPATAQRICKLTETTLPTPKLVDLVHRTAKSKLSPHGLHAGGLETNDRRDILVHQRSIDEQRTKRGVTLGSLIAGVKKDVVLSAQLAERPDRVVIYGWHKEDGEPIQRLSSVHGKAYADYSHGVRLVAEEMEIDGREHRVTEVLKDRVLAALLSDEGALRVTSYPN